MTFKIALENIKKAMRANRCVIVDPEELANQIGKRLWQETNASRFDDGDELARVAKLAIEKYIDDQHEQLLKD